MSTGNGICYQRSIGSRGVFAACIWKKFSYSLQWVTGAAGRLGSSKKILGYLEIPIHSYDHLKSGSSSRD